MNNGLFSDFELDSLDYQKRLLVKKYNKFVVKEKHIRNSTDSELVKSFEWYSELLIYGLEQGFSSYFLDSIRTKLSIIENEIIKRFIDNVVQSWSPDI